MERTVIGPWVIIQKYNTPWPKIIVTLDINRESVDGGDEQ